MYWRNILKGLPSSSVSYRNGLGSENRIKEKPIMTTFPIKHTACKHFTVQANMSLHCLKPVTPKKCSDFCNVGRVSVGFRMIAYKHVAV